MVNYTCTYSRLRGYIGSIVLLMPVPVGNEMLWQWSRTPGGMAGRDWRERVIPVAEPYSAIKKRILCLFGTVSFLQCKETKLVSVFSYRSLFCRTFCFGLRALLSGQYGCWQQPLSLFLWFWFPMFCYLRFWLLIS